MNKTYICTLLFLFLILKVSLAQKDKKEGTPLLQNYALAHKDVQLSETEKNLIGYENVDYVSTFSDCRNKVVSELNKWLQSDSIVSKTFENENNRVRVAIEFDTPANGEIIIIYRIYPKKQLAYLNILVDTPEVLSNRDREFLIRTYHLIELKGNLISGMKCE